MNARTVVIASGAILIVIGVGLILVQFWLYATTPDFTQPARSVNLEAIGAKAEVKTTYVGFALVVVGAFLEAVGLLVRKKDD